jgi:hypothetical protein
MELLFWIGLVLVVVIVIVVVQLVTVSGQKSAMEAKLASLSDFTPTQKFMGCDGRTGIAIDEDRKKVCLIIFQSEDSLASLFSYKDLLASEIFEDGSTITSTSRSSQAGGALIGALALGGVGAIIGGLSGKTTSTHKVRRVDLRITVNSTNTPLYDITFMDTEGPKDGIVYSVAMQQARHWHGLLSVLIRRADTEDASVKSSPSVAAFSVSDEIRKLSQLRDEGLLSEEEYSQQKARLLGQI